MSISIWRQYSSNHSADFTLIGAFPSEADAASAAAELRAIFSEVYVARAQLVADVLRQEVERRAAAHPELLTDEILAAAVAGRWDEALGADAATVRAGAEEALWRRPPLTEAEGVVVVRCVAPDARVACRLVEEVPERLRNPRSEDVQQAASEVERRGRTLTCRLFQPSRVPDALPTLVSSLNEAGCTALTYVWSQATGTGGST